MSKAAVVFGSNDLGKVKSEMTLVVKDMEGGVVATDGWTLTESQLGIYEVYIPGTLSLCTFKIYMTNNTSVSYEGFIGGDEVTLSTTQYAALAKEATLLSFIGSFVGTSFSALARIVRNLTVRAK